MLFYLQINKEEEMFNFNKLFKTKPIHVSKQAHLPNFLAFADEHSNYKSAYHNNVIVHRCINLIASSISHVPFIKTNENNKVLQLLKKPNPYYSASEFLEKLIAQKLIHGNAFILAKFNQNQPAELYLLDPKLVEITYKNGQISGYKYAINGQEFNYSLNNKTGISQILHLKNCNPDNNILGVSHLKAAKKAIEQHNLAIAWNNSLLKNGARPSGAIVMKGQNGQQNLTEEQFERIKEQLIENYSGASNSGKPLLLEGGLEWQEMSISPRDMDFIESRNNAAREIALALGVPPQLLGITGDNTYSNMQEARLALWEETLIPLMENISESLNRWLIALFASNFELKFDKSAISALTERQENILNKLVNCDFMTINEKRRRIGLADIKNGDQLFSEQNIS